MRLQKLKRQPQKLMPLAGLMVEGGGLKEDKIPDVSSRISTRPA
jgi:hypothetical protein